MYLELVRYDPRNSMFYCWGSEAAFHLDFLVCNPDLKCSLQLGNGADQIRASCGMWWGSVVQNSSFVCSVLSKPGVLPETPVLHPSISLHSQSMGEFP